MPKTKGQQNEDTLPRMMNESARQSGHVEDVGKHCVLVTVIFCYVSIRAQFHARNVDVPRGVGALIRDGNALLSVISHSVKWLHDSPNYDLLF